MPQRQPAAGDHDEKGGEAVWHLRICMFIRNIVCLDGSSKIKELVDRAKELGMDSMAITDHGVMYGVIDFYRAARAVGIKADYWMRGLRGARFPF